MHLESLVDSGWMLLDGWCYRVLQAREVCAHGARCAGKLRLIGIAADSTQSGAASSCHVLPSEKCHITR
jgi:hypothetical protein